MSEFIVEYQQTPVPDQAAFRSDFSVWLNNLSCQKRQITERLAVGNSTSEIAQGCRISPGRVIQICRELDDSWRGFHGELESCSQSLDAAQ